MPNIIKTKKIIPGFFRLLYNYMEAILRFMMILRQIFIFICLFLSACASPPSFHVNAEYTEKDLFNDGLFHPEISTIPLDEVFTLTAEQKNEFLKKYHSNKYRNLSSSERIYKYLKNKLKNFNFHSETLIASDAMALNSGNCMSLAILTKALSQLTHTGINYELARTPPVFQREGGFELSSQHIRTVVYNKNTSFTKQFIKPNNKVRIDYFSTLGSRTLRNVKAEEFYSLFYSNLAAEAMIRNEYRLAYWNIKEALNHKQDNLVAINLLGVLYQHINQYEMAEHSYLYGLTFGFDQLELLNNYHNLLMATNRFEEADLIAEQLSNYNDPDPFKWLDLADYEFKVGNYHKAISLYEKAAEKADYLHQPFAGIAKANYMLGRKYKAMESMEMALENAHTKQATSIYQAKYEYIKSHLKPK